ncbi:MAG: PAS domain S-box protein [Deltaproteobacteria bacterium]|nr:PAS domain S-box protein [Deltaproteobacteria bacterium]
MRSDSEKEYLLKVIDAFKRRLIVVSPEFKILAASSTFDGKPESEIVGKQCYQIFNDRSSPCVNCAVKETLQTGKPALNPKPDNSLGMRRMPCYYSYPIYSGEDIEAVVSMDFDLPAIKGLEEKMKQSNALLRNLIFSAVDGVIAAGKNGKIFIFNEMASEVFGYTEDAALKNLNIRDIYPDNLEYEIMKKLRDSEHGGRGKLRSYKVDVLSKNGETIPIRLNAAIVYEGKKEVATIGFFHDLREQLRLKDKMEKIQLQLMQAEKLSSLGKLAAGVAHQLNNPLGGITLFTKLLLEEYDLEEGARDDLHRILKDAERCRDTVKELLEFTRQTRHLMQPHDINLTISRTLFLLENQTLFNDIEIEKNMMPSPPFVMADTQQLNHLFMNIILNAVEAMGKNGKLTLKTSKSPKEDKLNIEISDTGPGIPEDVLPHIFDPFFTTKEEGKGTGLGLSMVYSIVENHGGKIMAKSKPGEGATFIIELPLATQSKEGDQSGKQT